MTQSAPPSPRAYPTRRSLREAEQPRERGRHGHPVPIEETAAFSAPAQQVPMIITRPAVPMCASLPREAEQEQVSRSARFRKRALHGVSAFGGAAALVLTVTVAGLGSAADPAAATLANKHQQLGTDLSSPDIAYESLGSVGAEELPPDAPTTFTNYADAEVQYPFAEPVMLTDGFGERDYPVAGFHDAQDFAAAPGHPIQAMADGVVLEAGWATDGCGFGLKLQHRIDGMDVTSRYCHMLAGSHSFAVGDRVSVGDQIGQVGATGIAFGAHLHFVVQVEGQAIDPMPFLWKYNRSTRPAQR